MMSEGMTPADIAAVTWNNGIGGEGGGFWFIILLLFAFMNNGNGWGNRMPFVPQNDDGAIQRGFDQAALTSDINNLMTQTSQLQQTMANNQMNTLQGFNGVQQGMCQGFNAVQNALSNNRFDIVNGITNGVYALNNTMMQNEMNRQNGCCETKQAIGDLKYTVATENCADRSAISDGIRDIIMSNMNNTNAIIENQNRNSQAVLDKLCQMEIDSLKSENDNLRSQLNINAIRDSQNTQTAQVLAGQSAQAAALRQALNPAPIPAYVVSNPNGCNCGFNACSV